MTRYAFFTLPLVLLAVSCDREPTRTALGPTMSLSTVAAHGPNSTICAAYTRQLTRVTGQLGLSPGNAVLEHRQTVLNNVIRDACR